MRGALSRLISGVVLGTVLWGVFIALRGELGVAVWQSNAWLTLAYAVVVLTAIGANTGGARQWRHRALWLFAAAGIGAAAAAIGGHSPLIGALVGASVHALVASVFIWSCDEPAPGWRRLVVALVGGWVVVSVLGSAWILTTAPAFAEGFVLLSLFLLAVLTALAVVLGFLVSRSVAAAGPALHPGRLAMIVVVSTAVLGGAGFYMVWAEGDKRPRLAGVPTRDEVFVAPAGEAAESGAASASARVRKADIIDMLAAQSQPSVVQLGNLALLTGEEHWAERFRDALLAEAEKQAFAGPAHSVKFGQYHAMLRALLYLELRRGQPALFSAAEQARIAEWLDAVLARSLTVEWVDLLYAIPFRNLPEGPYLNQEVGVGALSLLQHTVGDAELRERARSYLRRKAVGWRGNFRNLDDALEYQDIWMSNAYALWRYTDALDPAEAPGAQLAVDWLTAQLLQAPVPLNYGLIGPFQPLDALTIAAFGLRDGEARWLLDQRLAKLRDSGSRLPSSLGWLWLWDDNVTPMRPQRRSVAIAGPTGYNFRPGAMAPDKLVLRGAGEPELFALFGQRNRGWHRYPATGTLIALFFGTEPLVTERIVDRYHHWLPAGRAKHRDKKIDRLSLNGPMVARSGLDAWIGGVTGVYSRWSQAAPAFASLERFVLAEDLQVARMRMADWSGVDVVRTIAMRANRWLAVWDDLSGESGLSRAVNWNLVGFESGADAGRFLQQSGAAAGALVVADAHARLRSEPIVYASRPAWPAAAPDLRVMVESRSRLRTAAVFQTGEPLAVSGQVTDVAGVIRLGDAERLVFGGQGVWHVDGIASDAAVLHTSATQQGPRYRLFDAAHLALTAEDRCIDRLAIRTADADHWTTEDAAAGTAFTGRLDFSPGSDADLTLRLCDGDGSG